MTQRSHRVSSLYDGTHTPTRTWHSPWAVVATQSQNDALFIDSPGHTIGRLSSKSHRWFSRYLVSQLRDGTSGKLTGSYSQQRLKEEHQVSQIHKLMMRTPHTQRIATCLYALRRRASHAVSTNTTSPDGTTAATTSFASTSRPPPRKTSTRRQQHYYISWTKYAGPGGLRLWSL